MDITRAGRSPTFQDPGTPLNGLRFLESPLIWTPIRESGMDSRVPGYPGTPFQL